MKNEAIRIYYGKGCMTVNLEMFFPATKAKVVKLMKVIGMDYEHKDEIIEKLKKWLKEFIEDTEEEKKMIVSDYYRTMQKVASLQIQLERKQTLNGVPLTKDGVKNTREEMRKYKSEARGLNLDIRDFDKIHDALKMNLELLEGMVL